MRPVNKPPPDKGRKGGRPRTRPLITKNCEHCGKEFETPNPDAKYHSVECSRLGRRKVKNRPGRKQLEDDVKKLGWEGTGRKYGVTYNAVRAWARSCGMLPPED